MIVDGPKVKILDEKIYSILNQWLTEGYYRILDLSQNQVVEKFSQILKNAGIDQNEECILECGDFEDVDFLCKLSNSKEVYKINLYPGNIKSLRMREGTYDRNYVCIDLFESLEIYLSRCSYSTSNKIIIINNYDDVLNRFCIEIRSSGVSLKIRLDGITLTQSELLEKSVNKKSLKNILDGLKFPINIINVYYKIKNTLYKDMPIKNLEIMEERFGKMENSLKIKDNEVVSARISKNNKSIYYDNNSWSYNTNNVTLTKSNHDVINYNVSAYSDETINNASTFSENYAIACKEVQKVKKFTKSLVDKIK